MQEPFHPFFSTQAVVKDPFLIVKQKNAGIEANLIEGFSPKLSVDVLCVDDALLIQAKILKDGFHS